VERRNTRINEKYKSQSKYDYWISEILDYVDNKEGSKIEA